ncbi:MAG: DNA polymerase III subunit epsilon, partial [Nitrosopumilus sp. CG10_big_fil_rev_8_21_14_0_10_33_7]
NGKAIINFGQYQGKTLEDISKSDSGYLKWMTSADFSSEVKRIINNALEGKFPKPES